MIWVLALSYPAVIAVLFYFAFLRPVQQDRARQRREDRKSVVERV